jgi:hypothetical protein
VVQAAENLEARTRFRSDDLATDTAMALEALDRA